jgi:hypothetical protein
MCTLWRPDCAFSPVISAYVGVQALLHVGDGAYGLTGVKVSDAHPK